MRKTKAILRAQGIKKVFKTNENSDFLVLDHIDLSLNNGEIVALLGKSGSGKSTLLRILSGLSDPTHGTVYWDNQPISGPIKGMSMVFQNFALLPWLTVLQNVMLGLDSEPLTEQERLTRALKAIDDVGMDGFESAYPRELSGGMCQRVGLARALVIQPRVILMDEPFSSLDILTAENLRADLMDMWRKKEKALEAILLVTHNIEEAALLADRILIFSSNPGQVASEIKVDITGLRDESNPEFRMVVDKIYQHMSQTQQIQKKKGAFKKATPINHRLPSSSVSEVLGILEALETNSVNETIELATFGEEHGLDADDLFAIMEVMEILEFAHIRKGKIKLTSEGVSFSNANIQMQKKIFATQLLTHVELAMYIVKKINKAQNKIIEKDDIFKKLETYFSEDVAEEIFLTIIEWGRYAEVFAYDADLEQLTLEDVG
ncbi:MAG: nitrate ABC transporter ATP-binding protein [Legionellales bacterium]|jgi:NitT/TauT family transport system ATP-binding protein|nr:nitrate ABC transporter ATP-binding protein [Legionellales bacterium]OUX64618.1 MAG: hypothetical protein CBE41_02890 [Gammaproteobacteria bacterium TMED281]